MKKTAAAAAAAVMMLAGIPAVNAGAASSSTYSSNTPYYSNTTNLYYSTLDEALRATKGYYANGVYYGYNYGYSSAYPYYSSKTGYYYATYQDALTASGGVSSYVSRVVSNSNVNYVSAYSSSYPYYSSLTGKYYATYSDAVSDSGNRSDVVYYMYGSYNPYYYYGYYGYYPYYSSYYTPYYYTTYNTRTTTSSTNAADGVPYAYGNKKFWGWTNLASAINRLKSGSTYAIEMNGATLVPTEVLKVAKQRDINLQLVLANGVIWNIYGGNISSTDEVDLGISYDTSAVPKELISAAKKSNNAVSVAQISVGSGNTGALGLAGKASVKFSSKRANCFVKVYLYDDAEGNLKLVDKTIVDSKGRAQITVRYSGNYLLVLS